MACYSLELVDECADPALRAVPCAYILTMRASETFPWLHGVAARTYVQRNLGFRACPKTRADGRAVDGTNQDELDKSFNLSWGRLFKASNELSRFGAQVELYACCYTSKVSNFRHYSPMHYFRAPRESMSHDASLTSSSRKKAARSRTAAG